jgi:hypothetical protein
MQHPGNDDNVFNGKFSDIWLISEFVRSGTTADRSHWRARWPIFVPWLSVETSLAESVIPFRSGALVIPWYHRVGETSGTTQPAEGVLALRQS